MRGSTKFLRTTAAAALASGLAFGGGVRADDAVRKSRTTDTAAQQSTSPGTSAEGKPTKGDWTLQQQLEGIHETNLALINLAQMAVDRASSQEVKDFARKMLDEHRQLDFQLKQTAQQQLDVRLSGLDDRGQAKGKHQMKGVETASGSEFDRAFMEKVAAKHEKLLRKIDEAATHADRQSRPVVAEFLRGAGNVAQSHLQHIEQVSARAGTSSDQQAASGSPERMGGSDTAQSGIPGHPSDLTLSGTVASVTPGEQRITIAPDTGRSAELKVVPETMVMIDGKSASLQDIEAGDEVRVAYQRLGDEPIAVTITVGKSAAAGSDAGTNSDTGRKADSETRTGAGTQMPGTK